MHSELGRESSNLLRLLPKIVGKSDHRSQDKHGDKHHPGICMAIATLLKERNQEMCDIQTMISLVPLTSRVQKQVNTVYTNNVMHTKYIAH